MMKYFHTLCFSVFLITIASAQEMPEWFKDHMEYIVQGSGTWIADNSAYMNDQEKTEHYATEWEYGLGNQSIKGRLYGLINGEEVGTYWEFRTFWNPVEQKAYAYQFSGFGAVGMGEMTYENGVTIIDQMFYYPNGTTQGSGHKSKDFSGYQEITSFTITKEGVWEKNRFYKWMLSK